MERGTNIYGNVKDVNELSKQLMIKEGYRDRHSEEKGKLLRHEIIDVFWSVLVLANRLDVNLEKSFWEEMDKLEERIDGLKKTKVGIEKVTEIS